MLEKHKQIMLTNYAESSLSQAMRCLKSLFNSSDSNGKSHCKGGYVRIQYINHGLSDFIALFTQESCKPDSSQERDQEEI